MWDRFGGSFASLPILKLHSFEQLFRFWLLTCGTQFFVDTVVGVGLFTSNNNPMLDILSYFLTGTFILFGIIIMFGGFGSKEYAGWLHFPAGIVMVVCSIWGYINMSSFKEEQNEKYKGMDLIQYFDYLDDHRGESGIQDGIGFAIREVNLRAGPSTKYKVIKVLSNGEKINLTLRREGDWFQVKNRGKGGWIHGKYARPIQYDERDTYIDQSVVQGFKMALKGAFPEKTLKGKIGGYALGFGISTILGYVIFNFFEENKWRDAIVGGTPIAYFMVKNTSLNELSNLEGSTLLFSYMLVSILLSGPMEWLNFKVIKRMSV
jgi:hypothetical protein